MYADQRGGGERGGVYKWHHVIWILFIFLTQNFFFFFLVKKKDYRYTFPLPPPLPLPPLPWPSCAGFRQIYFSKHLWTLGGKKESVC